MRDGHLEARPVRLAAVVLAGGQARRFGGRDKPMVAVGGQPMVGRVLTAAAEAGMAPRVVVGPPREGLPAGVVVVQEEPPGGGPVAAVAAGLAALDAEAGVAARRAGDLAALNAEAGVVALRAGDLAALDPEAAVAARQASDLAASDAEAGVVGLPVLDAEVGVGLPVLNAEAGVGLPVLDAEVEVVALLAGDLPWLSADAIERLVGALGESDGAVFVDESGRRQVLCGVWRARALREAVRRLASVQGASMRALTEAMNVVEVRWEGGRPPYFDCDTEEDLRRVIDDE
ncbi:molybdenum cofactor guanylyltransferase [Dactylosporangium sp. CA-139066]|uniref:molybdenum cofactor guanylyltransferase n=1 Tax=Dactylosporangium sp. CA-139066 TaxID=3239930 RepID=UPI003D8DBE51